MPIRYIFLIILILVGLLLSPNLAENAEMPTVVEIIQIHQEPLSDVQLYAFERVRETWDSSQWYAFNRIVELESNWCSTIWNGMGECPKVAPLENPTNGSNGFGLCQTMMSLHEVDEDFLTNPYRQVDWCIKYLSGDRYGTPEIAWNFHIQNGWF